MGRLSGQRARALVTLCFLVGHPIAAWLTTSLELHNGALGLSVTLGLCVAYLLTIGPRGGLALVPVRVFELVLLEGDTLGQATVDAVLGTGLAVLAVLALETRFRRRGPVRTFGVIVDFGLIVGVALPLVLLGADVLVAVVTGRAVPPGDVLANTAIARGLGVIGIAPGLRMLLMRERVVIDRRAIVALVIAAVVSAFAAVGTLLVSGPQALVDAHIVIVPMFVLALLAGTAAYSVGMVGTVLLIMVGALFVPDGPSLTVTPMDHLLWFLVSFGGMAIATEGDRRRAITRELEALFQTSATPTLEVAQDGRILLANPAVAALTGWTVDELRGRPFADLLVEGGDAASQCRALFAGETSGRATAQVRTASGELRFVRCSGVRVDTGGGPDRDIVQVQLVDLTRERDREAELHRSNRALAELGRRVTHDLKQPLSAIAGYAGTLREHAERLDPSLVATMHERLDLAARRAVAQLDEAFDSAAVDGARAGSADLDACLRAVEEMLSIDLAETGARVERRLDVPSVAVDANVLRQVLLNLITNSIKYRASGTAPVVRVVSRARHGGVEIVVTDNGAGLPPEALESVFDRGVRLAPDSATGAGHGLADSRAIAEAAGGWLQAEPWPSGARFVLWLPDLGAEAHVQPVRVLLVDDEQDARRMLRLRLRLEEDIEVVGEAATIADAVEATATLRPDIVVLDRWLAHGDGLLAVAAMAEAHPDVRVVLLTADDSPDLPERARSGGVAACVSKSGDSDEIVRELVGARSA